jgi:hypothetical protein
MITGVAISPLLGVSAVGAYQYMRAPMEQRAKLAWFAQPWFWVPALLLVTLCFAKDVLGPTVPMVLKKPIDVAEAVENKVSGLVAAGAFVPLVAAIFPTVASGAQASLAAHGFAAVDISWLLNILMVPFAVAAFAIVWLVSHAINVLILISPFATVDAGLKAFRTLILSTVVLTSFANPYIGATWAAVIICISYFLAGWSFRLLVFGIVFIWDLLTLRRFRARPKANKVKMFMSRPINIVPVRTYGTLTTSAKGELVFSYRPWLVFPQRDFILPEGVYAIGKGLFYPELIQLDGATYKTMMLLPPRYRTHEEEVTQLYQLAAVQDIGLLKGFTAIWRWMKSLFGFRMRSAEAA